MSARSLDQLLREIEAKTSVDEEYIANITKVSRPVRARPVAALSETNSEITDSGVGQLARQELPPLSNSSVYRQARLPRLSARFVGGLVATLVLVTGLGTALVLQGQEQDIRQYATTPERQEIPTDLEVYQPQSINSGGRQTDNQLVTKPTGKTEQTDQTGQKQLASRWDNLKTKLSQNISTPLIVGGAIIIASLIWLLIFFHWLFAL